MHHLLGTLVLTLAWLVLPSLTAWARDAALERMHELEKQINERRDKLAAYENRAKELLDLLQQSEKRRAELAEAIRQSQLALSDLKKQETNLRATIKQQEQRLEKIKAEAKQATAWALSLSRGGALELLLSGATPNERLRHAGLLKTTLASIERHALAVSQDLASLNQQQQTLSINIAQQASETTRREQAAAEAELRSQQLTHTLKLVQSDANLTKQMIADLEESRRALAKIIADSRKGKRDLLALDPYKKNMQQPAAGKLMLHFGKQIDPVFGVEIDHPGWTYKVAKRTPVAAVAPGEAVYVGWLRGYGNLVVLRHGNDYFTLYAYLDDMLVSQGDQVAEGSLIGFSGDSGSMYGPALHFEIRHGKEPLDPADWIIR